MGSARLEESMSTDEEEGEDDEGWGEPSGLNVHEGESRGGLGRGVSSGASFADGGGPSMKSCVSSAGSG